MRNTKKNAIDYLIRNFDLSFSSKPMRVFLVICLVLSMVSGARLFSEKNYLIAQIADIDKQIEQKNRPLMLEVLNGCKGNLGDQTVVLGCIEDKRQELIQPLKSQLNSKRIFIFLWFVFWIILFSSYLLLLNKQKNLRKLEQEEV